MDEKFSKEYANVRCRVTYMRGEVISRSFQVEWYLTKTLARLFCGEYQENQEILGEKNLINFILNDLQFNRKIRILEDLITAGKISENTFRHEMVKRLDNIRVMRNFFAHCPIGLLAHQNGDKTTFDISISSSKGTVNVTQKLMEKFAVDVSTVLKDFYRLVEPNIAERTAQSDRVKRGRSGSR